MNKTHEQKTGSENRFTKQEKFLWLLQVLTIFSMGVHKFTVTSWREKIAEGQSLHLIESLLIHNILDYIGNVRNGYVIGFFAISLALFAGGVASEKNKKLVHNLALVIVSLGYLSLLYDIETSQTVYSQLYKLSPSLPGTPHLGDIPAGLIGYVMGVLAPKMFIMLLKKKAPEDWLSDDESD